MGLVDYIGLVGLGSRLEVRRERVTRKDSTISVFGIVDVQVVRAKRPESVPARYERISLTVGGSSASLNAGSLFRPSNFLCFSRSRKGTPITGIFISTPAAPRPPRGFESVPVATLRKGTSLYVERDTLKQPILSLHIVNVSKGEHAPPDYVCLPTDLNEGVFGTDILLLCYKAAATRPLCYEPCVLGRYPSADTSQFAFPSNVHEFAFPNGIYLTRALSLPEFYSFVFTDASKAEVYGMVFSFHEPISPEQEAMLHVQTRSTRDTIYATKGILLLSRWPFYDEFRKYLVQLHRIVMSPNTAPGFLEHALRYLYRDIPIPQPGTMVTSVVGLDDIELYRSPHIGMPFLNVSMRLLFQCLDIASIVSLFELLLLEQKVILYSKHYRILTPIAESLRSLLYPFHWPYTFIPVLPSSFYNVTQAPFPFLIGMHRSFLDEIRTGDDVVLVDLDRDTITMGKQDAAPLPTLLDPSIKQQLVSLLTSFSNVYKEIDFSKEDDLLPSFHAPRPSSIDNDKVFSPFDIRISFLGFFVQLFKHYSTFVSNGRTTMGADTFDKARFISCVDSMYVDAVSKIIEGQYFSKFLEQFSSIDFPSNLLLFDLAVSIWREQRPTFRTKMLSIIAPDRFISPATTTVIPSLALDQLQHGPQTKNRQPFPTHIPQLRRHFLDDIAPSSSAEQFNIAFGDVFRCDIAASYNHLCHDLVPDLEAVSITAATSDADGFCRETFTGYFDIWFALFHHMWRRDCCCDETECKQNAYSRFVQALMVLHRMTQLGLCPSETTLQRLCLLSFQRGILPAFSRSYTLLHVINCTPSPSFYERLMEAEAQLHRSSHIRARHRKKATDAPNMMYIKAVCDSCFYVLSGEDVFAGWYKLKSEERDKSICTLCPVCLSNVPAYLHVDIPGQPFICSFLPPWQVLADLDEIDALEDQQPLQDHRKGTFWNVLWSISFIGLPVQDLFAYAIEARHVRPLHEPWFVLFKEESAATSTPGSVTRALEAASNSQALSVVKGALEEGSIGSAMKELLRARARLREEEAAVLRMSMFTVLSVLNKKLRVMSHHELVAKYSTEITNFSATERDELIPSDSVPSLATTKAVASVSRSFYHFRELVVDRMVPAYIHTLREVKVLLGDLHSHTRSLLSLQPSPKVEKLMQDDSFRARWEFWAASCELMSFDDPERPRSLYEKLQKAKHIYAQFLRPGSEQCIADSAPEECQDLASYTDVLDLYRIKVRMLLEEELR